MNFSGRGEPLYVSLGHGGATRRRCTVESRGGHTAIERFLSSRFQGFTSIVRVAEGSGILAGSFGTYAIGAGDLLVVPPGSVVHGFAAAQRVEMLALPQQLRTGAIVRAPDVPPDLFERSDREIVALLQMLPQRAALERTTQEETLMRALAAIAWDAPAARLRPLAHALGYTADGLTALIQRHTGRSFVQWRDALTMASVRLMLATPGDSIAAIARELALESQYLHRRFARAHGTTPQRWRAAPSLPPNAIAHHWDAIAALLRPASPG